MCLQVHKQALPSCQQASSSSLCSESPLESRGCCAVFDTLYFVVHLGFTLTLYVYVYIYTFIYLFGCTRSYCSFTVA